jgi:hypothetical protein
MSLISQVSTAGMTGLEQLRAMLAQGRQPGIAAALQFSAIAFEHGLAVFEGEAGEHAVKSEEGSYFFEKK